MNTKLIPMTAVAMVFCLASCTSDGNETNANINTENEPTTEVQVQQTGPFRVCSPQPNWPLTEAQIQQSAKINDFSLRLFRLLQEEGKSLVFSPLSLSYALGMTGLGCDGIALKELNKALGLPDDDTTTLHNLLASLITNLPQLDDKVSLNLANAYYMNQMRSDVQINPDFRLALQNGYMAGCELLDFSKQASLDYINQWCSDQTKGFIPKVFERLEPSDIAILLNALYFKGDWTNPFCSDFTREDTFTTETGDMIKLPMMTQVEPTYFKYAEDELLQAIRLPYASGKFAMTVLLPVKGKTTDDILQTLSSERLAQFAKNMKGTDVIVTMPRFETKCNTNLVEPLNLMGLPSWFDDACLLRGLIQDLDGTPHGMYVSNAFQVSRIRVNEKGTEAAAVTVMTYTDKAMPNEPKYFTADHPFVYLITEESTNTILFVGTYHGEPVNSGDATGIQPVRL